ncbi:hypothetical protein [Actinacidiphila epipremni]|uniref:hypothetical protein n=1 Tax=Actinacidiphila epipremni TaxID=2053013 RepID=UPI001F0DD302|nr:hypothetical protein [Actinacidiphila epipremni]
MAILAAFGERTPEEVPESVDSMELAWLVHQVEQRYGGSVPDGALVRMTTVSAVVTELAALGLGITTAPSAAGPGAVGSEAGEPAASGSGVGGSRAGGPATGSPAGGSDAGGSPAGVPGAGGGFEVDVPGAGGFPAGGVRVGGRREEPGGG